MSGSSDSRGGELHNEGGRIRLTGEWTTRYLASLESALAEAALPQGHATVDASAMVSLDTGGAWLLYRTLVALRERGVATEIVGLSEEHRALLDLIETRTAQAGPEDRPERLGWVARLGSEAMARLALGGEMLAFLGEVSMTALRVLIHPTRIRIRAILVNLERAGAHAVPIVALLSFLLGIVVAYQGGLQLKGYGANIYIVELVSLTIFREFGPMMTAILVAGRTGSAFTAEIGTMKVTEEVDALKTLGIPPLEILVLPKLLGLVLALPLLTLVADVAGVLGGMVMASAMLDVSYTAFLDRLPRELIYRSFLIGIGKAPVFAFIVAIVGCFQGFRVTGSAESVGRQTTVSVVQSIFLVIVADAAFSIMFSWLGI